MRHTISHDLGLELACRTARAACDHYVTRFARYEPVVEWRDAQHGRIVFRAKGVEVTGLIAVAEGELDLELRVPLLLRPWQGRGLAIIEREFRLWLAKARAGEIA